MKKFFIPLALLFGVVYIVNAQTVVTCPNCGGSGVVYTIYGPMICPYCGGSGGVVVQTNESNVNFQGGSNQSDGYEYLGDVVLYTFNSNTNKYIQNSTHQLYRYWTGRVYIYYLDKNWRVSNCSYPRSLDFKYFVVDRWGTTYYFN